MNLKALIARFRVLANDKAEPYFWRDEEVSGWLNDAVHEACLRGRLLHSDDAFVTDVEKGRPLYAYATGEFAAGYVYEIDSIRFVSDGKPVCLKLVSPETADVCAPGWRDGAATGLPVYAVQGDEKLTLAPAPDRNGRLFVGGVLPAAGYGGGRGRAGNQFYSSSEFGLLGFGGGFQYPGYGDFRPAAFGIGKEAFRAVFRSADRQ